MTPNPPTADRLDRIEGMLREALEHASTTLPKFFTIDGAAAHVSLSAESIRRLVSAGKLDAHRPVKGRVLIDRIQLENFVATSTAAVRTGRGLSRKNV